MPLDTENATVGPSPLWIIALFIALTEVVAGIAAIRTDEHIQLIFALFVCIFPLIVLGVFAVVLWKRPYSFYTPRDYTEHTSVSDFVRAFQGSIHERETIVATAVSQAVGAVLTSDAAAERGSSPEEVGQAIADATRQLIAESSIVVDVRRLYHDPVSEESVSIPVDDDSTVQFLLNQIYWAISDVVAPFKYGEEWLLEQPTGERLTDIGTARARRHGNDDDTRLLRDVGIRPGTRLVAVPAPNLRKQGRSGMLERLRSERAAS
jgi:hypothetical protein